LTNIASTFLKSVRYFFIYFPFAVFIREFVLGRNVKRKPPGGSAPGRQRGFAPWPGLPVGVAMARCKW